MNTHKITTNLTMLLHELINVGFDVAEQPLCGDLETAHPDRQ